MDSFFAQIFLKLQKRITENMPEIRWVEQNFAQYSFDDFRPEAACPAVLIDFPDTPYSAIASNDQLGVSTINLVLLFAPYSQSYDLAPLEVKAKALEYYEIEHRLVKLLHGWTPGFCTPLVRVNAKSQNRNEVGLRIRDLNFSTEFEDYDSFDTRQEVTFSFNGAIAPEAS